MKHALLALSLLAGCSRPAPPFTSVREPTELAHDALPLEGVPRPASLDHVFFEPGGARVWVPVGATGAVHVLDTASGRFARIEGFKTAQRESRGKMRTVGPNAGAIGDGFAYIGNRASSEICPVDLRTLAPRPCLSLPLPTDGVWFVASLKEVWVMTGTSITVLDASRPETLAPKTTMSFDGEPEGYVIDDERGIAYTNLEDRGKTLAIDVRTHAVRSTWDPGCGPDGLRGLALDRRRQLLFVACPAHVQALDLGHDGARLGRVDAGLGVDTIDYDEGRRTLYLAAAKAARLTLARVDDGGKITIVAQGATGEGARNAVVDRNGDAYVADTAQARLLRFRAGRAR